MKVAILSIGDELLKGFTLNTHGQHIGKALFEIGIIPFETVTIADELDEIVGHIRRLLPRCDHLILTGGLGPTADDLTRDAVSNALSLPLESDPETVEELQKFWEKRFHTTMPPANLKQADKLRDATWILNPNGTAKGQVITFDGVTLWLLPGPPIELLPMLQSALIPTLKQSLTNFRHHRQLSVVGVAESTVEQRTLKALGNFPATLAYCAEPSFVRIYISTATAEEATCAMCILQNEFSTEHVSETTLYETLIHVLQNEKGKLSCAESCTGGLIASLLCAVPGASTVFWGGVVTYDNTAKTELLNVPSIIFETEGAVSESCCAAMLSGLLEKSKTDAVIAVTGIAGPDGGTVDKPVGTVYTGVYWRGVTRIQCHHFTGDRTRIRYRAAATALETLFRLIRSNEK